MRWFYRALCKVGAAVCMVALPQRIPKGITEPWKYRRLTSELTFIKVVAVYRGKKNNSTQVRVQTVRDMRRILTQPLKKDSAVETEVTFFDGVKVRLHRPTKKSEGPLPGFIYIHGGGLAQGDTEVYEPLTREICKQLNAFVVSIDYRKAPENTFPAPQEDCLKAAKWFLQNGDRYNVDVNRVGIGGDSAGGFLTTLTTQALHDVPDVPKFKVQTLLYPNTHMLDFNTPSYQKYDAVLGNDGVVPKVAVADFMCMHIFGKADLNFIRKAMQNLHISPEFKKSAPYLRQMDIERMIPEKYRMSPHYKGPINESDGDIDLWNKLKPIYQDQRACPLLREDFSGLPPAYIATAEFDVLQDDGFLYHYRLKEAGVESTIVNYETAFHGIMHLWGNFEFTVGNQMLQDCMNFARKYLS